MIRFTAVAVLAISSLTRSSTRADARFTVEEATIADVHRALADGSLTCRALVKSYLDRIDAYDKAGPRLHAIRSLTVNALKEAEAFDRDRSHLNREPLACVPVVLKDNFDTVELPTTGGSAALAGAQPAQDASVVAELRSAGAIILAKSNMQEFALGGVSVSSLAARYVTPMT